MEFCSGPKRSSQMRLAEFCAQPLLRSATSPPGPHGLLWFGQPHLTYTAVTDQLQQVIRADNRVIVAGHQRGCACHLGRWPPAERCNPSTTLPAATLLPAADRHRSRSYRRGIAGVLPLRRLRLSRGFVDQSGWLRSLIRAVPSQVAARNILQFAKNAVSQFLEYGGIAVPPSRQKQRDGDLLSQQRILSKIAAWLAGLPTNPRYTVSRSTPFLR